MKPKDMLEKFKQGAAKKTASTLEAICEECSERLQRGLSNFSVAAIAWPSHKRGVPREQGVRNKSAEFCRALIRSIA